MTYLSPHFPLISHLTRPSTPPDSSKALSPLDKAVSENYNPNHHMTDGSTIGLRKDNTMIRLSGFMVLIAVFVFGSMQALPKEPAGSGGRYEREMQETLTEWREEFEGRVELVADGVVTMEYQGFTMDVELDRGWYSVLGQPDSRFDPFNMTINVSDEHGDVIGMSSGEIPPDGPYRPFCTFVVGDEQTITIGFDLHELEEGEEGYAAYAIRYLMDIDEDSREAYIEEELNWLVYVAESYGEVITSETDTLARDDDSVELEFELLAGEYEFRAETGPLIVDLPVLVYDEDDVLICVAEKEYGRWRCWFALDRDQTITVRILNPISMRSFTAGACPPSRGENDKCTKADLILAIAMPGLVAIRPTKAGCS